MGLDRRSIAIETSAFCQGTLTSLQLLPKSQSSGMSAPLSLDEEVRLYTNNAEREKYGLLATLFGIIVSLEYLERAYVRDSVPASE